MNRDRKKKRSVLFWIVIIAAFAVLLYCLMQLYPKLEEYKESNDFYDDVRDHAVSDPSEDDKKELEDLIHIDWESLKGTGCVAWLQLDDISYPVMYSEDEPQKYLHHLPDGTYNYGGSLFLSSDNDPYFTDDNSFIYGHNMADRSMFGKLRNYRDSDYADHKFYIYLPDGTRHEYTFFSVLSVDKTDRAYTYSFASDESFLDYQEYVKGKSLYKTGPDVSTDNKLVSLSTCNGYTGTRRRLIVQGAETSVDLVQEKASWYTPKETVSYSESEEMLMEKLEELTECSPRQAEKMLAIFRKYDIPEPDTDNLIVESSDRGYVLKDLSLDGSGEILFVDDEEVLYAIREIDSEGDESWLYQEP